MLRKYGYLFYLTLSVCYDYKCGDGYVMSAVGRFKIDLSNIMLKLDLNGAQTCSSHCLLGSRNSPPCPLSYPIKSILQDSGLYNTLRKKIEIKQGSTFSKYFIVSKFFIRWMGLMEWHQFLNVWSKFNSIVNKWKRH
jgi:hypothetical protein